MDGKLPLRGRLGLVETIDAKLELLKVHLPYHESDHVLYHVMCGSTCLEDIEHLRIDGAYLPAPRIARQAGRRGHGLLADRSLRS